MRRKVERMVAKAAARAPRAVDAVVRFEENRRGRSVEVVLHAPRHAPLVAKAEGPFFGPAVAQALARLEAQLAKEKRTPKARARATGTRRTRD
jgi:ribosome-associated translation inhibitor RaiA